MGPDNAEFADARRLLSKSGVWRVELTPTEHSTISARGERRPYYHARFVRAADDSILVDCRKHRLLAWVLSDSELQLSTSPGAETWIAVDLETSDFCEANFREPLSRAFPLEELGQYLKREPV